MTPEHERDVSAAVAPAIGASWFRCRPFALAGRRVEVASSTIAVGQRFDRLLAAMPDAAASDDNDASLPPLWDVRINTGTTGPGTESDPGAGPGLGPDWFEVWIDGQLRSRCGQLSSCENKLLGLINRQALDDDPGRPHLHSGLVAHGTRGALIVGTSGSGKSTLVAWLVRAGWRYFSDEMVPVDAAGELAAFPRPLTLKRGSWPLFADLPSLAHIDGSRAQIPPGELGQLVAPAPVESVRPALIVFVSHGAAATSLTAISAREALLRMIPEVLDLERAGAAGMQRLIDLATAAPAALLEVADLASAGDMLRDAVLRDAVLDPTPARERAEVIPLAGRGDGQPVEPEVVDGSARVVLSSGCRAWSVGDGGVLYDLDRGTVLQIDAMGVSILTSLSGARALDAIAQEVGNVPDANSQEANDVVDFARALAGIGVLQLARPDTTTVTPDREPNEMSTT